MPRLEDAKSLTEADGHLHLDFGEGRTKKLKIDDLPESTVEHIRSVIKGREAAHEAIKNEPGPDGVVRADDGIDVPAPSDNGLRGRFITPPESPIVQPFDFSTTPVIAPAAPAGTDLSPDAEPPSISPRPEGMPPLDDIIGGRLEKYTESLPTDPRLATPERAAAEWLNPTPPEPAATPSPSASTSSETSPVPMGKGPVGSTTIKAPHGGGGSRDLLAGIPKGPDVGQYNADMAKLTGQDEGAVREIGAANEAYYQRKSALEKTLLDNVSALNKQNESQKAAAVTRQQQAIDAVANGDVDPSRLWNNADTGQKIAAGIGLILGGIGAGLTGQPNLAAQILDRAIDRDIDAQKQKLLKNKELVQMYRQQGIDIDAAFDRQRAQMKDMTAGMILREANKLGSVEARSNATMAANHIAERSRADQFGKLQEAHDRALRDKVTGYQVANLQANTAHTNAVTAAMKAAQNQRPDENIALIREALYKDGLDDPRLVNALPKEERERTVQWINGKTYTTASDKVAEKVRDRVEKIDQLQAIQKDLQKFRDDYSGGRMTADDANDAAQSMRARAIMLVNSATPGLGTMDAGTQPLLDAIIKDPAAFWTTDAKIKSANRQLQRQIDATSQSTKNAYLLTKRRAPGLDLQAEETPLQGRR